MLETLLGFVATFLALVLKNWISDLRREQQLKEQGAAAERERAKKASDDAEQRASEVPDADRDGVVRDLRRGMF